MSVKGYQLRLGLFAAVLALLCVNAMAPWGEQTAHGVFTAMQAGIGIGAIVAGWWSRAACTAWRGPGGCWSLRRSSAR